MFLDEIIPTLGEWFGCTYVHKREEKNSRPDHIARQLVGNRLEDKGGDSCCAVK